MALASRLFLILLVFALATTLASCAGSRKSKQKETSEGVDAVVVDPAETLAARAEALPTSPDDPTIQWIGNYIEDISVDTTSKGWKTRLSRPPVADFDSKRRYFWNLATNRGDLKLRLFTDVAPMHVTSTIYLTLLGFYDDVVFHRVIPGFMAQGGDPLGSGRGGPGYKYGGEFSPEARHDRRGVLSMANAGPNTDGSQFFITFTPTPHLDGRHTVFGELVEGMDTLASIEALGTGNRGATRQPIVIRRATISVE